MKPISFIYFDLGGVIIDNERAISTIAGEVGQDSETVQGFFDEHWRDACLGILSNEAYLEKFLSRFSPAIPITDLVDYFTDRQGHYQETHDFVHDLLKEYKLGILSNAERGIIKTLLEKKKIPNISWEVVIESAEHGMVKPDPSIYMLAQKLAGVAAEEILFIDDRPGNVEAARALGWHAEVFDFRNPGKSVEKLKTTHNLLSRS